MLIDHNYNFADETVAKRFDRALNELDRVSYSPDHFLASGNDLASLLSMKDIDPFKAGARQYSYDGIHVIGNQEGVTVSFLVALDANGKAWRFPCLLH